MTDTDKNLQAAIGHLDAGRLEQAEAIYRQILSSKPNDANALHGLASIALKVDRLDDAEQLARRAIAVEPRFGLAYFTLSEIHYRLGRKPEGVAALLTAINLGEALRRMGRPAEAAAYYERAIQSTTAPRHILYNNLAIVRMLQGQIQKAIGACRSALQLQPDYALVESNLLHLLHYDPASTAQSLTREHTEWGNTVESRVAPRREHANPRDPGRRLRIGYVSGDFCWHAIEHFIEPILASHDRSQFEITGYSNSLTSDASTARLRSQCDRWREIQGLGDDEAAELITRDGIDLLIDLSVHTARNRLLVFARKPAPVQMTYLGYPGTTGLPAIDYRITAAGMDIPGEVEGNEKLLALPHSYFCYLPLNDLSEVSTLPMQASGVVTFGSFNRLSKINATVIAAWSKILHAVPRSRLQLMAIGLGEPATRDDLQQHFAAHDVAPEQIVLHQPRDEPGYYAAHHQIDIMLDPFPFNGGTTTLHALWMGVPVVTLAGQLPVGRMGLNILTTAGLGDLVADSTDRYIALAAELAADPARLADLRRNMRQRLTNSPMMKAQDFTRSLEALYREAWKRWCEYTPS